MRLWPVSNVLFGLLLGCVFIWMVERYVTPKRLKHSMLLKPFGSPMETLVIVAVFFHSIPEGVAVSVAYGAETHGVEFSRLSFSIALAIAIHNIPERLAVACRGSICLEVLLVCCPEQPATTFGRRTSQHAGVVV